MHPGMVFAIQRTESGVKMEMTLQVRMDNLTFINLSSDYFHSSKIQITDENRLEIILFQKKLARLIKNDMECVLKIGKRTFNKGKVISTRNKNGGLVITCDIPGFIKKEES
jgi:hypothetical protein